MIISRSVLHRLRNVSDKNSRENQNTHFLLKKKNIYQKSCRLQENVEEYGRAGEATDENTIWRTRVACWITETTDTHSE